MVKEFHIQVRCCLLVHIRYAMIRGRVVHDNGVI